MLTHDALVRLYRENQPQQVLSIYLDAVATDPAQRSAWRTRLDQHVALAEKQPGDNPAEGMEGFSEALGLLRRELEAFDAFLPGKGWVGFATADRVLYAEAVSVPMPDLVCWERGIRVAPYVRGLKQGRPVVVALADRRRARVFEYRGGVASELEGALADTDVGDLTDVGVGKRSGTHSGVRGQTGSDAAQRFLDNEADRLVKQLARRLEAQMSSDGFLVLGGAPQTVSDLKQSLSAGLSRRVLEQPSLHLDMTVAQVRAAAEASASSLTQSNQTPMVAEVLDLARAGGRGCLGRVQTERALREGSVDTLLLTRTFIRQEPDFADHCVGAAFDQDAGVEELSGEPAQRMDQECGGIGARLRFVTQDPPSDSRTEGAGTA